jgi:hypothetical protein
MEDEILRAALAAGDTCLSVEQLGHYADGVLDAAEKRAADRHLRECLNCQAELALLVAVTSSGEQPGEAEIVRDGVARLDRRSPVLAHHAEHPTSRRWFPSGTFRVVALAAVLLIAVAAGGFYLLVARNAPRLPGSVTTGDEVTRSLSITLTGPIGDQIESPRRFEWVAVNRAVRYRVRLMEVDRQELWSTSTSALAVDLPSSVLASIVPGRTLLWDVTAYDAADGLIAESGAHSFRVVPR